MGGSVPHQLKPACSKILAVPIQKNKKKKVKSLRPREIHICGSPSEIERVSRSAKITWTMVVPPEFLSATYVSELKKHFKKML